MSARKSFINASVLLLSACLVACTTINPYTGKEETSNLAKGAAIGAAAGVGVGLITGDSADQRRKHALIGAGIGAITGGSIGYYMDVQEAKLRKRLASTGVGVTRAGNNIILNMPSNITFALDSAQLRPQFKDVLASVALVLKEYEKTLIDVAGHTDSTGSAAYNQELSERRARSVANFLRTQDIEPLRILTIGYGESRPIASNETASGRARNRRVELTLKPLTEE